MLLVLGVVVDVLEVALLGFELLLVELLVSPSDDPPRLMGLEVVELELEPLPCEVVAPVFVLSSVCVWCQTQRTNKKIKITTMTSARIRVAQRAQFLVPFFG